MAQTGEKVVLAVEVLVERLEKLEQEVVKLNKVVEELGQQRRKERADVWEELGRLRQSINGVHDFAKEVLRYTRLQFTTMR